MPQNWSKMQQSNRTPQLQLKKLFYRLDKEQEELHVARESEQSRLWTELLHYEKEYKKGLRRSFTKEDFLDPKVQIWPSKSSRLQGNNNDDHVQLTQVYREFLIFKTKKTLELFGGKPNRPRYSELYKRAEAPKFNNERSVTLLLDRTRPLTPPSKIKQLALVIPKRLPEQDIKLSNQQTQDEDSLLLPAIIDGVLATNDAVESSPHSQSERSPPKPHVNTAGRQSVSRDSLRRGFPMTSEAFPTAAIISASNVKLGGLDETTYSNNGEDNETERDRPPIKEINKTFITQPMERRLPDIEDSNKDEEIKMVKPTQLPNIY